MLISRIAERSSRSSLSSTTKESSITDRRGSLNHLKAVLRHDIGKCLENKSFVQEFKCSLLNEFESDWLLALVFIKDDGIALLYHGGTGGQLIGQIKLPQSNVIGHLGKHLIQISTEQETYLFDCSPEMFVPVCSTLLLWSRLRPAGIQNKLWLPPTQELEDPEADLLRCEVEAHFTVYNPQYTHWSSFLARLKRSGEVQLSDPRSQVIYTLQVRQVLGSRIKVVDTSVIDSKMVLLLFSDMGGPDSVYLRFSDIDDFEDWVATLKSLSLQPVATTLTHDPYQSVRWGHKLHFQISSCQQAPGATSLVNLAETYVDICISRWVFARTCLNADPRAANWGQSFEIPEPDTSMPGSLLPSQVELKLKQRKSPDSSIGSDQDVTVGSVTIPYPLANSSWQTFTLSPSNVTINASIYESKIPILHASYYTKLYELMSDLELRLPSRLVASAPSSLSKLFPIFNRIYRAQGRQLEWMLALASEEVQRIDIQSDTLFRETSLFTRGIESILQQEGGEILQKTVGRFVRKLVVGTEGSLELDPARSANPEEIESNAIAMGHFLNYLWSLIKSEGPPSVCIPIFRHLKTEILNLGLPEVQQHKILARTVSSLLFLRFYVPALLNPQLFHLTDRTLKPTHRRTLVLIAKILQSFANRVRFGAKEMWLNPMNRFIEDHDDELLAWYLNICGFSTDTSIRKVPSVGKVDELAADRPPKELPVETFMGQELTSPNLEDEWEAYAQFVEFVVVHYSQKDPEGEQDPMIAEIRAECESITVRRDNILRMLEAVDSFEDSSAGSVPHIFLNPETMLFGTNESQLDSVAVKQARPSPSFSDGLSRFGWFPKNRAMSDESEESRQKSIGSVRKLTQMLKISKPSSR